MSKDTFYFSHDYNARNDVKIKKLLSVHGYLGYGLYWAIIEDLYNNTNVLRLDYDSISFDLRCSVDVVKSVINDFDLFVIHADIFGSASVERRLNERNEKSKKARESILYRWSKQKKDTNVLQPNNDSNTIKERKGKEKKGNNKKSLHSFSESPFFDKQKFAESLEGWERDKLAYYYQSAVDYSESKNAKYANWVSAVRNWERKDKTENKGYHSPQRVKPQDNKNRGLI